MEKLPLFIITGASGSGKTTVMSELISLLPAFNIFDIDFIYEYIGDWQKVKNAWIHIAYEAAKNNRRTVLCGTILPDNISGNKYIHIFSQVYFINLHCNPDTRRSRLIDRGWAEKEVNEHENFAQWILDNSASFIYPTQSIYTDDMQPLEVAKEIKQIIDNIINS